MIPVFYKNIKFEMEAFLEKPLEWAIFIRPYSDYTLIQDQPDSHQWDWNPCSQLIYCMIFSENIGDQSSKDLDSGWMPSLATKKDVLSFEYIK